jgi:hypothetical protein
MAKEKDPITLGKGWPPSYPSRQHHNSDHDGDQQERVGGFPNQYLCDVHCRLLECVARPFFISFATLSPLLFNAWCM